MTQDTIYLHCYAFNEKGQAIPLFSPDNLLTKNERDDFQRWREIVRQVPLPAPCKLSEATIQKWLVNEEPYRKRIILLFALMKHLADPQVYQQLPNSDIRKISSRNASSELSIPPVSNFNFQPVITIGERDIMELYEQPHESDHHLKDFPAPDPRFKFFDSSIWHGYEYLLADRRQGDKIIKAVDPTTFFDRIDVRIREMVQHHQDNLYVTNAARSSLELQLRLLRESFIERFGNRGHYKAVTPFKFHSESSMKSKADKLIKDFYQGFLWKIQEKVRINWRFLMVDDYANSPISTFSPDGQLVCKWTKRSLILHLLEGLEEGIDIDYPLAMDSKELDKDVDLETENTAEKSAKSNIIRTSLDYLSKKHYDIILLDYLLGRIGDTEYREFGHQFLQRLNTDAQTDGKYNRGPYGRFWIFPISSFPFAMQDKLKQLDIGHFNLWWYLVDGCDPISTPQMFRYSLLSFLQHQISEVLLSPTELAHLIGKFTYTYDEKLWTKILSAEVNEVLLKIELLKADRDNSLFADSMIRKLSARYANRLQTIKDLADGFHINVDFDENEANFNKIYLPWTKLRKQGGRNGYQKVVDRMDQEFERLRIFSRIRHIEDMVNYNVEKQHPELNLGSRSLLVLPNAVARATHITSLDLSNNKLESLPNFLIKLTKLRKLNLSNNKLDSLPGFLAELPNLRELDLSGHYLHAVPPVLLKLQDQLEVLHLEGTDLPLAFYSATINTKVKEMLASANRVAFDQAIAKIERILKENKLIEAIEMIKKSEVLDVSPEQQIDLIHCEARVRQAILDRSKGLINYSTQRVQESEVREGLLVILNDLKKLP